MADRMSEAARSFTMSRIRSTGSGIEAILCELILEVVPTDELRRNDDLLPGRPDAYVPSRRLAFFADGCFFHGCPDHFTMPENNRDYWQKKIERNRERDREVCEELDALGIRTVRIWGHVLRGDPDEARNRVSEALARIGTP